MFFKKLRAVFLPALLLLLLSIALILLLDTLIQRPSIQGFLLARLSKATGYELRAGSVEVSLWGGIGFSARDLEARSRTGSEVIMASSVGITLDARKLIRGCIVPTRISLSRPSIELAARKGRGPSISGDGFAFEEMLGQRLGELDSVSLKDGRVSINDFPLKLEGLYLDVSRRGRDPIRLQVDLKGKVESEGEKVPFTVQGTITRNTKAKGDPFAEMTLKTGQVPLTWIPWPASLPLKEGRAEACIKVRSLLNGPVSIEGKIMAKDLRFLLVRPGRTKEFSLPRLAFDFESLYSKRVLQISSLEANASDFSQTASLKVDLRDSSNPYLDLRIESPFMSLQTFKRVFPGPLLPQWLENRLFPLFTGGDVRLALFSLKGTLNQIRHLREPDNAKVLSVGVSCKNLEVLNDARTLPFDNISGELGIENGDFFVSGVKARFGRSTIRHACLEIKNVFCKDRSHQVSVEGLFDLGDLMQQKEIDLIPVDVRHQLHGFESASGGLEARFEVGHKSSWDHPRILKGEFSFRDCSIAHKGLVLPLSLDEANLNFDREGQTQFRGAGLWGGSKFKVSGSAQNSWETVKAHVEARADMNEIMDRFCQRHQLPVEFSGPVTCRGSLSRRKDLWSCQGELDLEGVIIETDSFYMDPPGKQDRIIIGMELHPGEKIQLNRFGCNFGGSCLELSGFYNLRDKDSFHLNVRAARLEMKDLGIQFKKTNRITRGILSCQAEVNGSLRDLLKTSVNGEIEGQNLSFVMSRLPSPISDCHFKLRFSGKEAFIDSLKMQVGQSPIHFQGNLRGWDGVKGELTVNSNYLDLTDIIGNGTGSGFMGKESGQSSFIKRSDVSLKLNVLKGQWKEMKYGPSRAECAFRSGDFYIERSEVQMEHGILTVKGYVKNGREPERLFSVYSKMTKQPMKEFLHSLGLEKTYIEGLLTGEAVLFVKGRNKNELISTLTGSANLLVEKGKLQKPQVLFRILEFLSLQNIFKKKPPDISKGGFYFDSIEGHVSIDNGVLETENLVIKSPIFNVAGQGKVDLPKKWVDYDLGVQPLGTIDFLFSKVPIVGYILTGKEKSLLIYHFKVKGPLFGPDVQYVPLKNLGSSIIEVFKRLFLTPGRLFKDISRAAKDLAKKGDPLPDEAF